MKLHLNAETFKRLQEIQIQDITYKIFYYYLFKILLIFEKDLIKLLFDNHFQHFQLLPYSHSLSNPQPLQLKIVRFILISNLGTRDSVDVPLIKQQHLNSDGVQQCRHVNTFATQKIINNAICKRRPSIFF